MLWNLTRCDKIDCLNEGSAKGKPKWLAEDSNVLQFDYENLSIQDSRLLGMKFNKGRVAIFASWSHDYIIHDYIIYYLRHLRSAVDAIAFISDNYYPPSELRKILPLIDYYHCAKHGEYDFGSWKIGIEVLNSLNILNKIKELVICNDSCYGPLYDFNNLFNYMDQRECDFWGISNSLEIQEHVQSFFVTFRKNIITDPCFIEFFRNVKKQPSIWDVVLNYETRLTGWLQNHGYQYKVLLNSNFIFDKISVNLTKYPLRCIDFNMASLQSPLIKRKNFSEIVHFNKDSLLKYISYINKSNKELCKIILHNVNIKEKYELARIGFSLILYLNNCNKIDVINSILAQTFRNLELIIIADANAGNIHEFLNKAYQNELTSGKIKLLGNDEPIGEVASRNYAQTSARNEWICHIHATDRLRDCHLEFFAFAIAENKTKKLFYAQEEDKKFSAESLCSAPVNMAGFVYHKSLAAGFDCKWGVWFFNDFIYKLIAVESPVHIPMDLLASCSDAASVEDGSGFRLAHSGLIKASMVIFDIADSHQAERLLESVFMQSGDFEREVLICAPLACQGLDAIIDSWKLRHPFEIGSVIHSDNPFAGLRDCVANATGDYVFFLRGGDVWLHPHRIWRFLQYMAKHENSHICVGCGFGAAGSPLPAQSYSREVSCEAFLNEASTGWPCFSAIAARSVFIKNAPAHIYDSASPLFCLAIYALNFGPIVMLRVQDAIFGASVNPKENIELIRAQIAACRAARSFAAKKRRDWLDGEMDSLRRKLDELMEKRHG